MDKVGYLVCFLEFCFFLYLEMKSEFIVCKMLILIGKIKKNICFLVFFLEVFSFFIIVFYFFVIM